MTTVAEVKKHAKKKYKDMNELSTAANTAWHVILIIGCLCCILPLWIVISASLTKNQALVINGYGFWPSEFSVDAYTFMFTGGASMGTAYKNTIIATVSGVILCTISVGLYAYPLSRSDFRYTQIFTFISFFTMLFNAGTVASYIVNTQILKLKDTMWALFLPMSFSAYWVIVMRTFYKSNVPESVIESARIDGAGEWRTFLQIVAPLAIPGFATVALFAAVGIWNNFMMCLLLNNDRTYWNLQYTLYSILKSIQFLREMASAGSSSGASVATTAVADLPSESFRMAMAVASMGPIILAYPFFQKFFMKGLTIGAVKG